MKNLIVAREKEKAELERLMNEPTAQKVAMRQLLEDLHKRYSRAVIVGHHDLNPHKDCPCIPNVAREYADLQPK